jgi:hypothetical protein
MDTHHLFAAALIVFFTLIGVLAACVSQRLRDLFFLMMVAGTAVPERISVNFWSHDHYRGTSRGVEISGLDLLALSVLVASLLVPRPGQRRWYWPAGLTGLGFFGAYCLGSVLLAEPQIYGTFELWKLLRGGVFFLATALYLRSLREVKLLVLGLVCAVGFEALVSFRQRFFVDMVRVQGHLNHPNSLSMYLCLVGPLMVAGAAAVGLPQWLRRASLVALVLAAGAMILTLSRTGVPAFALVVLAATACCVSWRLTWRKFAVGLTCLMVIGLVLAASWKPLVARYGESTLSEEYLEGGEGRGIYLRWAGMIVADHGWGVGLNNWSYWVSKVYGAREGINYEDYDSSKGLVDPTRRFPGYYAAPAHNLGALILGELGVAGLLLFALLWLRWFWVAVAFVFRRSPDPMRVLGVGIFFGFNGVFLQSLTEWTYRHSPIFITFHILAGALAGLHYYWRTKKAAVPVASDAFRAEPDCFGGFGSAVIGVEVKSS